MEPSLSPLPGAPLPSAPRAPGPPGLWQPRVLYFLVLTTALLGGAPLTGSAPDDFLLLCVCKEPRLPKGPPSPQCDERGVLPRARGFTVCPSTILETNDLERAVPPSPPKEEQGRGLHSLSCEPFRLKDHFDCRGQRGKAPFSQLTRQTPGLPCAVLVDTAPMSLGH